MVAFIKKTDEDRDYITFHNSGKISEITPHIYNYLFQEKTIIAHGKYPEEKKDLFISIKL